MASDDDLVLTQIIQSEIASRPTGTGSALARAVGVTPETVSKWKRGDIVPDPSRFSAIEEFFELPSGTLRHAAGLAPEGEVPLMRRLADLELRIAELQGAVGGLESLVSRLEDVLLPEPTDRQ